MISSSGSESVHITFSDVLKERRGCPAPQTSLRSLRKLDCVAGHDGDVLRQLDRKRSSSARLANTNSHYESSVLLTSSI
jgi:hypothetical protein